MENKRNKKRKGFTLVELVVVIAILAVLAASAVAAYSNLSAAAQKSADKGNITTITRTLNTFNNLASLVDTNTSGTGTPTWSPPLTGEFTTATIATTDEYSARWLRVLRITTIAGDVDHDAGIYLGMVDVNMGVTIEDSTLATLLDHGWTIVFDDDEELWTSNIFEN